MKLFLVLLSAVNAFGFSHAHSEPHYDMVEKAHTYTDGDTVLNGHLMYQDIPGASDRAGLLIFPYFMGTPAVLDYDVGRSYAEKGMVVFVADYYGANYDETNQEHIALALSTTYPAFLADSAKAARVALLGLEQLTSLPMVSADHIGVIGFCMGGSMTSILARAGGKVAVAISLHGDNTPGENEAIAEYQVDYFASFFGRNDPLIPSTAVEAAQDWLTESTAKQDDDHHGDYEVTVYSNTVHAFSHPVGEDFLAVLDSFGYGGAAAYSERRGKSAFERVDSLFLEHGLLL